MSQFKQRLSVGSLKAPVGHFGLFDICTNQDLISLSYQGVDRFIDWLGFRLTTEEIVKRGFVAWTRPSFSSGAASAGWLSDPCADANGVDWGKCDFTLTDFARLRRAAPVRDITKNTSRRCINEPRYRVDGSQIMDVDEWDLNLAMSVVLNDFRQMLVNGNINTSGQFDGLQRLIKTGYTNADASLCEMMDSLVVNWNNNPLAGGSGITLNGGAVASTYSLIDILLWTHQTIRTRKMMSPQLAAQQRRVGDEILLMPSFMARTVLDAYTCWSVCPGRQYNETNLNSYEARAFRTALNGGPYGFGQITLDGDVIPIMGYDWGTQTGGRVKLASLTRSSTTATATTVQAHGLTTGDSVTISGATGTEYNITATVTVSSATVFTYTVSGTPTSPDASTSIYANIPMKADVYYLSGMAGNMRLMEIEGLDFTSAPDIGQGLGFNVLDGGRFLTWINGDNTCIERNLEMRPRLLSWAPWANARIQNIAVSQPGQPIAMDPSSLAFPMKTFASAT